ncbi:hypothetical protein [Gordonia crocea]|uniref:DUF1298 domain-containing protein n=1 Tax=Gordonia crocea TaxID=589162 RepID=A0A7I9V050_9ACTN|nr:hypothetical protein [Gordonia crocea]GED98807.1 hypothetical protein nbrc107697_28460 [Gordonia crocea]
MTRLHPVDARMLWSAPQMRSDQFLLFAFDGNASPIDEVCAALLHRASAISSLTTVISEVPGHLDYPSWVHAPATADQIRVHRLEDPTWTGMLARLADLLAAQLDPGTAAWRLHLFDAVAGPDDPGGSAGLRVAVLQISHARHDGRGASAVARRLFGAPSAPEADGGRVGAVPTGVVLTGAVPSGAVRAAAGVLRLPVQVGRLVVDGAAAYRLSRSAGHPGPGPVAPAPINGRPGPRRALRTLTVARDRLGGRVTPAAVAVIGDALAAGGLVDGDPVVELTLARATRRGPANDFHMVGIASRTDLSGESRLAAITAAIDAARERDRAPARVAARRAEAATPAPLMHWAATSVDPGDGPPPAVTGHTVVSSVNRGAADLTLAGGRVRLTAGFPALSPVHRLTHGVHGIGATVTFSVQADPEALDIDAHVGALRAALDR